MQRDVAIVALFNEQDEIFLVRTHAYPDMWQPVGGGIDDEDADIRSAAVREVFEELGLKLSANDLFESIRVPFDFGEGTIFCFYAHVSSSNSFAIDSTEIADSTWTTLGNALLLPAYPATKTFLKHLYETRK